MQSQGARYHWERKGPNRGLNSEIALIPRTSHGESFAGRDSNLRDARASSQRASDLSRQLGLTTVEYAVAGAIVTLALLAGFTNLREAVLTSILRIAEIVGAL